MADRFVDAGHEVGRIDELIVHDDGRISLGEMFKKKQYYGQSFARYLQTRETTRPRRLARPAVFAHSRQLVGRPELGAGLILLKSVETAGLATGVVRAWRN